MSHRRRRPQAGLASGQGLRRLIEDRLWPIRRTRAQALLTVSSAPVTAQKLGAAPVAPLIRDLSPVTRCG